MRRAKNVSFNGQPIEMVMTSPYLVLLDPLVLDGLRRPFQALAGLDPVQRVAAIGGFRGTMRIGVHEIEEFRPGEYRLGASDFEAVRDQTTQGDVCDVDSGTIIAADIARIHDLAGILTWDRYDHALQSPLDDDSRFLALVDELGGTCFAMLNSVEGTPFNGDGSYKLRTGAPTAVNR